MSILLNSARFPHLKIISHPIFSLQKIAILNADKAEPVDVASLVSSFGKHGDGSGDFSAPKGVALDSEGHVYVADAGFDNVQVFDEAGKLLLFWGTSGQEAGKFWLPAGLLIDAQDRIYVADSYNKRVQIFQYVGGRNAK